MGFGGAIQGHTPTEGSAGAVQALPGSTAPQGGQAGLGTPPELPGASKGQGQCPTEHGRAPTAPRRRGNEYVSHLCSDTIHTGHST